MGGLNYLKLGIIRPQIYSSSSDESEDEPERSAPAPKAIGEAGVGLIPLPWVMKTPGDLKIDGLSAACYCCWVARKSFCS